MDKKQQFIEKSLNKILTSKFIIALALALPTEVYDDFIKEIAKVIHLQLSECWDMAIDKIRNDLINEPAGYSKSVINSLESYFEVLTSQKEGKECENCGTDTEQHTCVNCEQDIPSYICEEYKGMCPHCSWLIGK